MKTVVMLLGFLLLGAMAYYGYSYGVEKSAEFNKAQKSNELPIEKVQSIDTEVAIDEEASEEQKEEDIAVKASIEEEIPAEVDEVVDEEDIIEDGPVAEEEEPADIEAIIDEQEELMEEAAKEENEESNTTVYSSQEIMQKIEKEKAGIPILETEEERIIREEEEKNKAAIEEDNNLSE